jgi:hypothetical protein
MNHQQIIQHAHACVAMHSIPPLLVTDVLLHRAFYIRFSWIVQPQQTAHILSIQHARGFVAAGIPLGTTDFISTYMQDGADQAIALISDCSTSRRP